MTFTRKVITSLVAGIACGLFLGERAEPMQILASGFVKLLQMTVLPYVVLSIISSLGALSFEDARRLGLRVGLVILGLWALTIVFVLLMPLTFPSVERGSFFSTSMLEKPHPFNFVDLFIPSNPFHSLANNIVPAIVLFSVIVGVALIGVPEKQKLLDVMHVAIQAISRATRFIVKLTPYGIFAIATHAAGTLSLEQIGRIEIYLVAYVAIVLLMSFWVLPALVTALTHIPLRDVFQPNRDALMTAFVAGDVFIVLPSLMDACEQALRRHNIGTSLEQKLPEVIVPASFNFPHTGKLLSLSFILFAGWFADSALSWQEYPHFATAGILTIFGSLNAAVPFLLDLFRIPADTFQLFLATSVINARFGSLLAAVHLIVVALIGTVAIAGAVRFQPARLIRYGAITLILTAGTILGLRAVFARMLRPNSDGAAIINNLRPLFPAPPPVPIPPNSPPPPQHPGGVYESILARGVVRVCLFENRIPFVYQNAHGELVGFEVEAANLLAREFDAKVEFLLIPTRDFEMALDSDRCDIVMSGVALTPRREGKVLFSKSYLDETLAFVTLDHRRHEFSDWSSIRSLGRLRLAVPALPHYLQLIGDRLPGAEVVAMDLDGISLNAGSGFDAYVLPAEMASAATLLKPAFSVVVPGPEPIRIPIAYPVARRDDHWVRIVDDWIELRQKDGTFDRLYRHWILGQSARPRGRRWSILDNVIGVKP